MSNYTQSGAVNVPLGAHERALAMTLYDATEIFLHAVYESTDNADDQLIEDLIDDTRLLFFEKGSTFSDDAAQCLAHHARKWLQCSQDTVKITENDKGITIFNDRHFNFSLVSGYIQTLQKQFDLPSISFQFIRKSVPFEPDSTLCFIAEVSKDNISLLDTRFFLQERDDAALTFFDHIRLGRTASAIECIESGSHDLDAFDGRALKWAARYHQVKIFKKLLEAGARCNIPDLEKLIETSSEMKAALQSRVMKETIEARCEHGAMTRPAMNKNRQRL